MTITVTVVTHSVQHPAILETHRLDWPDEAACDATARAMAACAEVHHAFITLQGPLGAGKTHFARALLRALGVQGRIKSPTFALLEPYAVGDTVISHVDLYRMDDPREFADAGLRDVMADAGLKLVEWPERAGTLLPTPDLHLLIAVLDDDTRRVTLAAHTRAGLGLIAATRASSSPSLPVALR